MFDDERRTDSVRWQPKQQSSAAYIGLWASFALTALIIGLSTLTNVNRFFVWTNMLYAWPAARAVAIGAYSPALVFTLTALVSTFYHSCTESTVLRANLRLDAYAAAAVIVTLLAAATIHHQRQRRADDGDFWSIIAALGALAAWIATLVIGVAGTLDGCMAPMPSAPALFGVWQELDFGTAFASLLVALLYFVDIGDALDVGVFYVFLVIMLVGKRFVYAGFGTDTAVYTTLAIAGALVLVARCIHWGMDETAARDWRALKRRAGFVVVALVATLLAFSFFAGDIHGLWHIFSAAALLAILDTHHSVRVFTQRRKNS